MAKQGEKTMTPRLRFPEFRAQRAWEIKELSQLLTISNGLSLPQNNSGSGLKVTRIETIADGTIDIDRVGYVDTLKKDIEDYRLNVGDVLFSNINSVAHIGKSVLIEADQDLYHGMNLLRLRIDTKPNSPSFIYFSINTPSVRESFREKANKAVNQASINQTELGRTFILAPSRLEQQKIADCLTSLDEVIAAQGRKVEALKAHKRGLMQQLFPRKGETRPRRRFPEFHKDNQSSFKSVGEFAKVTTGNKDTQNKIDDGKYPFFVRSQNVEHIDSFSYDGEAVLTSGDGVGVGENYHYINGKFEFHQRVYSICEFDSDACGRFFFYFFAMHFNKRVKQMSAKNSVDSVRMPMITEMPVWFPPLAEQQRIADCLSSVDTQVAAEADQLAALKAHKQGLMQQLFPSPENVAA